MIYSECTRNGVQRVDNRLFLESVSLPVGKKQCLNVMPIRLVLYRIVLNSQEWDYVISNYNMCDLHNVILFGNRYSDRFLLQQTLLTVIAYKNH